VLFVRLAATPLEMWENCRLSRRSRLRTRWKRSVIHHNWVSATGMGISIRHREFDVELELPLANHS
jgi:hypothetical protein